MLDGFASPEGTARYRFRYASSTASDHFRSVRGLWISSIGLGTYLGKPTPEDDTAYEEAVREALSSGCNVLDSAINYRFQRSERSVGRALRKAVEAGTVGRDEVIVATKGGFLSFDGGYPADPGEWVVNTFLRPGIIDAAEIVADCHCLAPSYMDHQFEASRANLGLERIDIYYVHNPETQLGAVDRKEFLGRVEGAFQVLERKVAEGRLTMYGVATWDGLRKPPEARDHLSLAEILEAARAAARAVGSESHHFGAVQLPVNLAMAEALLLATQRIASGETGGASTSLLQAARLEGLVVMGSASILQGHLPGRIPREMVEAIPGGRTPVHKAIQWARSAPGLTTALVGMKSLEHVRENLELAGSPRMTLEEHRALIRSRS